MKKNIITILFWLLFCSTGLAQIPYPGNDHMSGVGSMGFPNGYTGNVSFYTRDIIVGGSIGKQGLIWKRRATSRSTQAEKHFGLGHNWTHNWQWEMMYDGTDTQGRQVISIHKPSGVIHRFVEIENGEWESGPNVRERLIVQGDIFTFQLRTKEVGQVKFIRKNNGLENSFYPSEYMDSNGNEWQFIHSQGKLVQIIEPAGRWLKIHYCKLTDPTGPDGLPPFDLISRVEASDGQEVVYNYEFPKGSVYPVLSEILYPDETKAIYVYKKNHPLARHLLVSADDPHGDNRLRASIFNYRDESNAPSGQLKNIQSFDGGIISAIYPCDGVLRCVKIQKMNGAFEHKTYYPGGHCDETRDSLGFSRVYSYTDDGYGLLASVTDELGNITSHEYNAYGDRIKTVYPDNTLKTWQYDKAGRIVTSTDELEHTINFERDGLGRITRVVYPNGHAREMSYNQFGQVLKIKEPDGAFTAFSLDHRGLCESITDSEGNTSYTIYDAKDRISEVVDTRKNRTVFKRDKTGRILEIIYDDGVREEWKYDRFGAGIQKTDPMGNRKTMTYDDFGRLIQTLDPLGNQTTYDYAPIGQLGASRSQAVKILYPGGLESARTFDENGLLTVVTIAPGTAREGKTVYKYDGKGRQVRKINSLGGIKQYFYDNRDRLAQEVSPLGNTIFFEYNAAGKKIKETDAMGNVVQWTYDVMGREIAKTNANGQVSKMSYDASGRLKELIDPKGLVYGYEYDGSGRRTALVYSDGSRETWSYNAAGRKDLYTNRSGASCIYEYDNRNRLIYSHWDDESQTTYREYDKSGRTTLIDNGMSKLSYTYDPNGRLLSETQDISPLSETPGGDPAPATIRYTYHPDGNLASMTYPEGSRFDYQYTLDRHLREIRAGDNGEPFIVYEYGSLGNIVRSVRDNSTRTEFEYDEDENVTQMTYKDPEMSELGNLEYAYDKTGNPVSITNVAGANTYRNHYEYDAISQLVGVNRIWDLEGTKKQAVPFETNYEFDEAGNRIQVYDDGLVTSYQVDQLNTYDAAGNSTTQYDGNGNLSGIEGLKFRYDALNRLVEVSGDQLSARFLYDGKNRVVMRNINGEITFNTFSGWNLIEERDTKGDRKAIYLFGHRTDEMVVMTNEHGTLYPHYDALGSVVMLTDSQGSLVERYQYAPFGRVNILNAFGEELKKSAVDNRWFFTGREWLDQPGLYDFRNRVYSPALGRFLQTDPIRFSAGDMNLYRYVFNNPIRFSDPFGLEIRVYSSDAFGIQGINHAFVWSTELNQGVGRDGSSGNVNGPGFPSGFNHNAAPYNTWDYNVVSDLNGMTESQFVNSIRGNSTLNDGFWAPYINDCHTDLQDAFSDVGVYYPGAPNGRVDLDNWFINSLNTAIDWVYDVFTSWME